METIRTRRYSLDPETYFRAIWGRDLWRPVLILGSVAIASSSVVAFMVSPDEKLKTLLLAWIGDVGMVALLVGARYSLARRKMNSPEAQSSLGDPRVVEFTESSLSFESESGVQSRIPWEKLDEVERRPPYVLFLIGREWCLAVPTDAFETIADRQALEQFLFQRGLLKKKSG